MSGCNKVGEQKVKRGCESQNYYSTQLNPIDLTPATADQQASSQAYIWFKYSGLSYQTNVMLGIFNKEIPALEFL